MKTLSPARLDQDTPKWPEVRITLGDHPTVTVGGVVTPVDDEATAIGRCAAQARSLGRPIRARLTAADGTLRRLIVTTDAAVTALDSPVTTPTAMGTSTSGKAPSRKVGRGRAKKGPISRFPAPLRPVIRWGAPAMGLLAVASVVVMVVNGRGSTADAAGPQPTAPIPPGGQLYTELAPPGWSQDAAWVIQLAKDAPAPVVAGDGTIVAVTARDHSAVPADGDDRYLSVLEPDGRTRWAVPLDTPPRTGPLLLTVDGALVATIAGTRELTYWPLTGGPETTVQLPPGAKISPTGLITLPEDRLGYLHKGALQIVDGLPRTEPARVLDGAALVTQSDTGAWWTITADAAPKVIRPQSPDGASAFDRVLAVGADRVLLAWTTTNPRTAIVTVHDRDTGTLTATTSAPATALPRNQASYQASGTRAGAGSVVQFGTTLTVVPGLSVTRVADQIYGTTTGDPVLVNPDGQTTKLPAGTLLPIAQSSDNLLVVGALNKLYALNRRAG